MKTRLLPILFAALIFIPLLASAGTSLYYGSIQYCNAGVISTNPTHLNCDTYETDYTTSVQSPLSFDTDSYVGRPKALYVGTVPYCNAAVVSTNPDHMGCSTQPSTQFIGYTSASGFGTPLYVGTGVGCNEGVVSTNPTHLNCSTQFIGYTALTTIVVTPSVDGLSGLPAGTSFDISGPVSFSGISWDGFVRFDGTTWNEDHFYSKNSNSWKYGGGPLPAGTYTITWGALAGYTPPPSQTLTVAEGETINFVGDYARLTPTPTSAVSSSVTVYVAPSITFTGSDTAGVDSATPTIVSGNSSNLKWKTTDSLSCTASGAVGGNVPPGGPFTWSTGALTAPHPPSDQYAYTITCSPLPGSGAAAVSKTVTITVTPPATPQPTSSGGASCTTQLTWTTVADGSSVIAYQAPSVNYPAQCLWITRACNNGDLSPSGSNYIYQSCSVIGTPSSQPPTGGICYTPTVPSVPPVCLSGDDWLVNENARYMVECSAGVIQPYCYGSGCWTTPGTGTNIEIGRDYISGRTMYRCTTGNLEISSFGSWSTVTRSDNGLPLKCRELTECPLPPAPTVKLLANGADVATIPYRDSVTLTWNILRATSCTTEGGSLGVWDGPPLTIPVSIVSSGGSVMIGPLTTSGTFTLQCTNSVGKSGKLDSITGQPLPESVTVNVNPPPPLPTTPVFSAIARIGTSAVANITGLGFAPDLVISKPRIYASVGGNWIDSIRGAEEALFSDQTSPRNITYDSLTAFGTDGITLGVDDTSGYINSSGMSYINYFFRRAPGFFDEVTLGLYNATSERLPHNLGAVPELIILKARTDISSWLVYDKDLGVGQYLNLNTTAGKTAGAYGEIIAPTGTDFGFDSRVWGLPAGNKLVAYLFATLPGVSKVGSYTGTGNTAKTIDAGLFGSPAFVLIKRTDAPGDWYVYDSVRGIVAGGNDPYILLNTATPEVTGTNYIDPAPGGFTLNAAPNPINTSGGTYIYLAISGVSASISATPSTVSYDDASTIGSTLTLTSANATHCKLGFWANTYVYDGPYQWNYHYIPQWNNVADYYAGDINKTYYQSTGALLSGRRYSFQCDNSVAPGYMQSGWKDAVITVCNAGDTLSGGVCVGTPAITDFSMSPNPVLSGGTVSVSVSCINSNYLTLDYLPPGSSYFSFFTPGWNNYDMPYSFLVPFMMNTNIFTIPGVYKIGVICRPTAGSWPMAQLGNYWFTVCSQGDIIKNGACAAMTAPTVVLPSIAVDGVGPVDTITTTSAVLRGKVTSDGGAGITHHGTCWGIVSPPTGTERCFDGGTFPTGTFSQARAGLPAGTTIYYRAFATNSVGTGVADGQFTTLSPPCQDTADIISDNTPPTERGTHSGSKYKYAVTKFNIIDPVANPVYCFWNAGTTNYYVPIGSPSEIKAFFDFIPNSIVQGGSVPSPTTSSGPQYLYKEQW